MTVKALFLTMLVIVFNTHASDVASWVGARLARNTIYWTTFGWPLNKTRWEGTRRASMSFSNLLITGNLVYIDHGNILAEGNKSHYLIYSQYVPISWSALRNDQSTGDDFHRPQTYFKHAFHLEIAVHYLWWRGMSFLFTVGSIPLENWHESTHNLLILTLNTADNLLQAQQPMQQVISCT